MKIAHSVIVTPNKCGLYESTHELASGLRALGFDAQLFDPAPGDNPINWRGDSDRGVPVSSIKWAEDADIIVSHSGIGDLFHDAKYRVVYVAHGRPYVSYLSERAGNKKLYSAFNSWNRDVRYRAVVTFWPEHVPYLDFFFPDKPVHSVQCPVDLEFWRPGEAFDWGERGGVTNVLIADAWREDRDPFLALHAYGVWARQQANAKLHIVDLDKRALKGANAFLKRLREDGTLGFTAERVSPQALRRLYNGADFLLTPHVIDVRTVREAMACGCPVVRVGESLKLDEPTTSRAEVRREAERRLSSLETAKQFATILESLDGWNTAPVNSGHTENRTVS